MQRDHHCRFETEAGFVRGPIPAVMCKCGNWAMCGGGRWRIVPWNFLPFPCQVMTQMLRAARCLCVCAIALAIGFLVAMWNEDLRSQRLQN